MQTFSFGMCILEAKDVNEAIKIFKENYKYEIAYVIPEDFIITITK